MSYKYKFSVIMAVYNVEDYVAESIDSIINQDIGFENVQLILVEDGSPDNSGAICDEYAKKYSNIVVIHKENGGVSSARNAGLDVIEGQFVNFVDPDDLLTPNTLTDVYNFFMEYIDDVDIVSIPLYFFEGRKGNHALNFKYNKGTRLVDLTEDWFNPQLSLSSSFVKSKFFENGQNRFDTRLIYAEDAQLIQRFLCEKQTLGLIKECKYMYRQRVSGGSSALQTAGLKVEWFLPCVKYFHMETINYYKERLGYVPKFIQATLMYDLQWRLKRNVPDGLLSEEETQEYFNIVKEIMSYIDTDVITIQKQANSEIKVFAHTLKYGRQPDVIPDGDNDLALAYDGEIFYHLSNCSANLQFIKMSKDKVYIDGLVNMFNIDFDSFDVKLSVNNELYDTEVSEFSSVNGLNTVILNRRRFICEVPLKKRKNEIQVVVYINKVPIKLYNISYGKFAPVSGVYKKAYFYNDKRILTKERDRLHINSCGKLKHFFKSCRFLTEMWMRNKNGGRNAVKARIITKFMKLYKRKPIWLISDRASKAGDNGEALFRYMVENHPEIETYFVITDDCSDYKEMQKVGNVVVKESFKHKLMLLMSEYIISSHAEDYIFNPFYTYNHGYRDILAKKKYVFLQHGITKDDLSGWLNKHNKNIFGFITAAKPEYNSILEYDYKYDENQVWLTGFARFDRLYREEKKQITVMPTWRKYIMGTLDKKTGIWSIKDDFAETDFVKFYSSLLNSKKLSEALKKYGYTLAFMPHPNIQPYLDYFKGDCDVTFLGQETNYRDIYAYSNLIITDYSSAVFDFAYLRKPVLYCHFDHDQFFGGGHSYEKGYFDYERDGFGEVEYSVESTVDRIIEYMENDCKVKDKYLERIDNFFAFSDQNNCQRHYEMMIEKRNK